MARTARFASILLLLIATNLRAQEVMIARDAQPKYPKAVAVTPAKPDLTIQKAVAVQPTKSEPAPPALGPKPVSATPRSEPSRSAVVEIKPQMPATTKVAVKKETPSFLPASATARVDKSPRFASSPPPKPAIAVTVPKAADVEEEDPTPVVVTKPAGKKVEVAKAEPRSSKAEVASAPSLPSRIPEAKLPAKKVEVAKAAPAPPPAPRIDMSNSHLTGPRISEAAAPQPISFSGETAFVKLADGFDFPVGRPDAQGYYKARGFRSHGHLGEDWDGVGGGDTDLGDPIYCIGDGVVVFARDCHMGWGNVVIVRHSYRESGSVRYVDSLYGHLDKILVRRGQAVARGQKIAAMGNAHGLYDAHLHLEIRKNLEIGMSRAAFARDFSNYYDPTTFINSHRHLQSNGATYRVAMNTFTHDARINFDRARNFSHAHSGGGTSESAANLKKAVASHGE
jgi:murein DD-endopeptidase MepM/ murein hydrolase activator NlpD